MVGTSVWGFGGSVLVPSSLLLWSWDQATGREQGTENCQRTGTKQQAGNREQGTENYQRTVRVKGFAQEVWVPQPFRTDRTEIGQIGHSL